MEFKYCGLSSDAAKQQCDKLAHDANLSFEDKVEELKLIAYSRVYDVIGGSYDLEFPEAPGTMRICARCFNIMRMRIVHATTFWKAPAQSKLPNIILRYDRGLIRDWIDCGDI